MSVSPFGGVVLIPISHGKAEGKDPEMHAFRFSLRGLA